MTEMGSLPVGREAAPKPTRLLNHEYHAGALRISRRRVMLGSCTNRCPSAIAKAGTRPASRVLTIAGWPAGLLCEGCAATALGVWLGAVGPMKTERKVAA